MDELWELPDNIRTYIYDKDVSLQMYSSPVGDAFEGLDPEAGIATVIVENDAGEFLFIKHTEDERYWELPSGHIESDENPENAARREVREETGYLVTDVEPLFVVVWPFDSTVRVQIVFSAMAGEKVSYGDGEAEQLSWQSSVPENVTFGELGKEMYEFYLSSSGADIESRSYLREGLALVGVGLSAAAFKGLQMYRERSKDSSDEGDSTTEDQN